METQDRAPEEVVREYLYGVQNEHRRNELLRALDGLAAERDLAISAAQESRRLKEEAVALRQCRMYGCTLPAGHNQGKADIPANHRVGLEHLESKIRMWIWDPHGNGAAALMSLDMLVARVKELERDNGHAYAAYRQLTEGA